jgi:hypothetical protein
MPIQEYVVRLQNDVWEILLGNHLLRGQLLAARAAASESMCLCIASTM